MLLVNPNGPVQEYSVPPDAVRVKVSHEQLPRLDADVSGKSFTLTETTFDKIEQDDMARLFLSETAKRYNDTPVAILGGRVYVVPVAPAIFFQVMPLSSLDCH